MNTSKAYRIPVTTLEAYRLLLNEDWMTVEKFVAQVTNQEPANAEMEIGNAVHRCLERVTRWAGTARAPYWKDEQTGFFIKTADAWEMIPSGILLGVPEVKMIMPFATTDGDTIYLSGVADLVCGAQVWDYKTTADKPDVAKYVDSLQWKCYLQGLNATRFTYVVAQTFVNTELSIDGAYPVDGMTDVTPDQTATPVNVISLGKPETITLDRQQGSDLEIGMFASGLIRTLRDLNILSRFIVDETKGAQV